MILRRAALLAALAVPACIPMAQPAAYQPPDPAAQREAFAKSMGYPTRKSPAELDQTIAQQTKNFKANGKTGEVQLAAPAPITFNGVSGVCYTFVMHLSDGAAWGLGAEAGLKFDFQRPEISGSGGPGVVGPGAVASVGCAESTGPITLSLAPMVGQDPMGTGALKWELYSHVLSRTEKQNLEADKQRQIAEQREFAAREREREARARQEREAEFARSREESSRANSGGGGGGGGGGGSSGPVYVTIRSACDHTVPVFFGDKPGFGSGTKSSVSSNSVSSHSFRVGEQFWIIDDSERGVDSVSVGPGTRELEITSGCNRISSR